MYFLFTCRALPSQASTAQPVQPSAGDAGQDQSKAGAAVPVSGSASNTPTQPAWNPFDDDNFSNLGAEEFKAEEKKPAGRVWCKWIWEVFLVINKLVMIGCFFSQTHLQNSSQHPLRSWYQACWTQLWIFHPKKLVCLHRQEDTWNSIHPLVRSSQSHAVPINISSSLILVMYDRQTATLHILCQHSRILGLNYLHNTCNKASTYHESSQQRAVTIKYRTYLVKLSEILYLTLNPLERKLDSSVSSKIRGDNQSITKWHRLLTDQLQTQEANKEWKQNHHSAC